jgi:hypothetical protein
MGEAAMVIETNTQCHEPLAPHTRSLSKRGSQQHLIHIAPSFNNAFNLVLHNFMPSSPQFGFP